MRPVFQFILGAGSFYIQGEGIFRNHQSWNAFPKSLAIILVPFSPAPWVDIAFVFKYKETKTQMSVQNIYLCIKPHVILPVLSSSHVIVRPGDVLTIPASLFKIIGAFQLRPNVWRVNNFNRTLKLLCFKQEQNKHWVE